MNKSAQGDETRPDPRFVFALFTILGLLAFGNSLFNEYAYDGGVVMERWTTSDGSSHPISTLFSPPLYSEFTGVMSYRPVGVAIGYLWDISLFGSNPVFSHLLNIMLHVLASWLFYLILSRWSELESWREPLLPLFGSLFFLLHPIVTECVYCIGFRFDILAMVFTLLAIRIAMGGWIRTPGWALALSCLLVMLGLFSKESAAVAIPAIPAFAYLCTRDIRKAVLWTAAMVVTFALFFVVWWNFRYTDYPASYFGDGGRMLGMANFLAILVFVYTPRLFVPWPLRVDYALEPATSFSDPFIVASIIVMLLLVTGVIWISRRSPQVAIGSAWITISFLPVSQLVPIPDPVAERFVYVPLIGVAMVVTGVLRLLTGAGLVRRERALYPIAALFLVYTALDIGRGFQWRDDVTLNIANWESAHDDRPVALESLGALYLTKASVSKAEGDTAASEASIRSSRANLDLLLESDPENFDALRLMAIGYMMEEEEPEALEFLDRAKKLAPEDPTLIPLYERLSGP